MDLGFETIGNATLICHDRGPLLVTDPWMTGPAYFGSWTMSHEIPEEQRQNILGSQFVWLSHGHPDHLSGESLLQLKEKKILLPDHVGSRIYRGLKDEGYDVHVLKDREWVQLSQRVRALSIADYNQDGILLLDIGGKLIVNLNDASDMGWARFVKKLVKSYDVSFLLKLSGYGDADMINCFDEEGKAILPWAAKRYPVGKQIANVTNQFGIKYFVPFSSMHRYQRSDSIWANQYTTRVEDYPNGFTSKNSELLSPFVRYDCVKDRLEKIEPAVWNQRVFAPEEFGDDWSVPMSGTDIRRIKDYFLSIEYTRRFFDFIRFRVGGKEYTVDMQGRRGRAGITFEVPRQSLILAIKNEIFDDLLIGNFMKTTLHGYRAARLLYPHFTPYVAKYADNGRAKTKDEIEAYFLAYRRRAPLDYFFHCVQRRSVDIFRLLLPQNSYRYRFARGVYNRFKICDSKNS